MCGVVRVPAPYKDAWIEEDEDEEEDDKEEEDGGGDERDIG